MRPSRIAHSRGALAEAETHFNQAVQTFASFRSRYELVRNQLDLALVTRAQGKQEVATTHLQEAYHLFSALRIPRYVERTQQLAKEFGVMLSP